VAAAITTEPISVSSGWACPRRPPGAICWKAYNYVETAWWLWFFPGLLIALTVLSINSWATDAMPSTRTAGRSDRRTALRMDSERILEIRDLRTRFHIAEGTVYAVNGVSFTLNEGRRSRL
jgi:hypothetical protein